MRVLAVVPGIYDRSPGQRYRIEQWEPLLKQHGVDITYAPFEDEALNSIVYQPGHLGRKLALVSKAMGRRFSLMPAAKNYDLVYLFREAALLGPAIFERLIYRAGVPIVFDFDDAIFVSYKSPSNGYLSYLKFAKKTATICRMSAHVIVGNPYLADYARQFNQHVTIVPTTIDTDRYNVPRKESTDPPVIGWTGSHSTVQHLDTLRGALQRLEKEERFRLRVVGTPTYELEGVDVEIKQWRSDSEARDLADVSIGVMPLPDDNWSKGKCGLKALQFMSLGIPTICSPVGVNTEIIQHGQNGLLARTEDEWVEQLKRLLRSPELRKTLGEAGKRTVQSRYSAKVQAPKVCEVFESVLRGGVKSQTADRSESATLSTGS